MNSNSRPSDLYNHLDKLNLHENTRKRNLVLLNDILMLPFKGEREYCYAHVGMSGFNLFVFDQLTENALTYLPQTWSTHPSLAAEEFYWNWVTGSKVKATRIKCAKTGKVTISKMNFFFIHLCNLFELTNPVVQKYL